MMSLLFCGLLSALSSVGRASLQGNYFICLDGCNLTADWYNDSYCDCSECEDEPNWTCGTCAGACPASGNCTGGYPCDSGSTYAHNYTYTYNNNYSYPYNYNYTYHSNYTYNYNYTGDYYTCSDGCQVPSSYYNDSWCDCPDCSDEVMWSCDTCAQGCPDTCNNANGWCWSSNNMYNGSTTDSGSDNDRINYTSSEEGGMDGNETDETDAPAPAPTPSPVDDAGAAAATYVVTMAGGVFITMMVLIAAALTA